MAASAEIKNKVEALLMELIRFPSTRGNEGPAMRFLGEQIAPWVDTCALVPIDDAIIQDPDYAFPLPGQTYRDTPNLECLIHGKPHGPTIVFNTHLDVVPPSEGQTDAFLPRQGEGRIFGRGACDAKGQAAVLFALAYLLRERGLQPAGNLLFHLVIEEESGGNGTLAMIRRGVRADAAIILEPTDLQIAHLVRGAVWFEVVTKGKAGHSGSPGSTASALKEAVRVIEAIEKVREEFLVTSRKVLSQIATHPNPMPCTFGMLHSGNWPAAAPSEAVLKGVFGFLPPFHRRDIQERLIRAIHPFHAEIRFNMLNSDPSFIPDDHPLVRSLIEAARRTGISARPEFMNASCDSWRYTEQLGIPAVVFGAGSITSAHSGEEHISIGALRKAAEVLMIFIQNWSGLCHV